RTIVDGQYRTARTSAGKLSLSYFRNVGEFASQVSPACLGFKYVGCGKEQYDTGRQQWSLPAGYLLTLAPEEDFAASLMASDAKPINGICVDLPLTHFSAAELALFTRFFVDQSLPIASYAVGAVLDELLAKGDVSVTPGFIRDYLAQFSRQLMVHHQELRSLAKKTATTDTRLGQMLTARNYLFHQRRQPFSLAALSRAVGLSPFLLSRLFKHTFGLTPLGFHTEKRLRTAAQELVEAPNLSTLAYSLGYGSPASFSRAFRRHYGYSPSIGKKARLGKMPGRD
ncbi:MAG: AraC family transcriptional regulator, partial [Bacteroidota bacterium]